jgi:hypothetical protein
MLSIAYTKSFEVNTQFKCHITYKSNHIHRPSQKRVSLENHVCLTNTLPGRHSFWMG